MTLPDFLVLGAARSATTSLHYYLEQHPDVVMSTIKEPNFFAFDHAVDPPAPLIDPASPIVTKSVPDRADYERLFAHAAPGNAVGDASPLYLYVREAPEQIRQLIPEPRLIAVLRNPVDRAYSHWLHINRDRPDVVLSGVRRDFETEMAGSPEYAPYSGASTVLRMGLYDTQIARYVDTFGSDALLVLPYESVIDDASTALARICDHLGVAPHDFDTDVQYNPSGVTNGRVRNAVTRSVRSAQPTLKAVLPRGVTRRLGRLRARFDRPDAAPTLPEDLRARLVDWYAPSVDRLRQFDVVGTLPWAEFD